MPVPVSVSVWDVPRAPRLGPLRLPAGLLDDDGADEDDDGEDENGYEAQDAYDDEGFLVSSSYPPAALAPLDEFGALQALPDLDAFGRLSLF